MVIFLLPQMKSLRLRNVKWFTQSHKASEGQRKISKPSLLASSLFHLIKEPQQTDILAQILSLTCFSHYGWIIHSHLVLGNKWVVWTRWFLSYFHVIFLTFRLGLKHGYQRQSWEQLKKDVLLLKGHPSQSDPHTQGACRWHPPLSITFWLSSSLGVNACPCSGLYILVAILIAM